MPGVAFVDANRVAVRVVNERHPADRRWERLHLELHVVCLQVRDGCVEILDFKPDETTLLCGLPAGRARADGERAAGDVVFRPLHSAGFADDVSGLQAEHAFIKLPRPRHVGDGVTGECDFGDFNHFPQFKSTVVVVLSTDFEKIDLRESAACFMKSSFGSCSACLSVGIAVFADSPNSPNAITAI